MGILTYNVSLPVIFLKPNIITIFKCRCCLTLINHFTSELQIEGGKAWNHNLHHKLGLRGKCVVSSSVLQHRRNPPFSTLSSLRWRARWTPSQTTLAKGRKYQTDIRTVSHVCREYTTSLLFSFKEITYIMYVLMPSRIFKPSKTFNVM